jgi:hypothetical protein
MRNEQGDRGKQGQRLWGFRARPHTLSLHALTSLCRCRWPLQNSSAMLSTSCPLLRGPHNSRMSPRQMLGRHMCSYLTITTLYPHGALSQF